ncbi:MAG: saccharopine dehydrogenase NADP-binding domain-containing protein [Clostridiales bacterium]|nr:saccharopine dehydrogenase NADP-binding domain-containing protein [Clostridiales bacterium]
MKKVLILGCTDTTEQIITRLCADGRCVSEICIASKDKNECNELKKKVQTKSVRIITAGIDVTNTEGAMMMARIFGPDLIINLMPVELTDNILKLALNVGASYLDFEIHNVPDNPKYTDLLGTQFKYFADFKKQGLTAVTGCGYDPAALTACIRNANGIDFDKIESIDFIKTGKDGQPEAEPDEPEDKDGKPEEEAPLYREDLTGEAEEVPEEEESGEVKLEGGGAARIVDGSVDFVEVPKPEPEKNGKSYRLVPDVVITDIIKEFPDFKNVRCLKETAPLKLKDTKKKNKREEAKKEKQKKEILNALEKVGLLSSDPVVISNLEVIPYDFMRLFLPERPAPKKKKGVRYPDAKNTPCEKIRITGTIGDKKKTCEYKVNVSDFDEVETKVAVAASKMMCLDKWKNPGVFTTAKFPNGEFIDALAAEGISFVSKETASE